MTSGDSEGDRRTVPIFNLNMQRLNRLSLGDKSDIGSASSEANSHGHLSFQFMEHELPYNRRPLFDKVEIIGYSFCLFISLSSEVNVVEDAPWPICRYRYLHLGAPI